MSLGGNWAGFRFYADTEKTEFSPLCWEEVEPLIGMRFPLGLCTGLLRPAVGTKHEDLTATLQGEFLPALIMSAKRHLPGVTCDRLIGPDDRNAVILNFNASSSRRILLASRGT
ncbi:hypothetical protein FGADI_8775 [Fusarium gaditjirri]|uniref:Uncharacterized protein n=1 Tax=Fusarium gaditjirri TaxID=282569 RepID=A0A8H4WTI4_9HYPO|nr:hypothetical protein FGADI_8775 [Fusarium gaditjirri]